MYSEAMMTPADTYTIQQASALVELPSTTLRYYEDIGLIGPIARASSGHRRYTDADLRAITFVKRLRFTGMPVEEMCEFMALYRGGTATATRRREILEAHRQAVRARVDELVTMLEFIDYKIGLYQDEEVEHERKQHYELSAAG